jgi:hypothetical protein
VYLSTSYGALEKKLASSFSPENRRDLWRRKISEIEHAADEEESQGEGERLFHGGGRDRRAPSRPNANNLCNETSGQVG